MYTRNFLCSLGATLCGVVMLTGCANQLPQRSEHEERIERKLLEHHLHIDAGDAKVLELAQRRVRIHDQKTYDVTTYEVTRRYDRYTPYQAWRELYEIPAGAVALVAGVTSNVVNVVALGSLPTSVTRDWIRYGIDGINPLMNVESNGRAEQNLASIGEAQQDRRTEQINLPWAERPVSVRFNEHEYELLSDNNGILRLNLLNHPFSEQDIAQISTITLEVHDSLIDSSTQAQVKLLVSPALRGKLQEAHNLIFDELEDNDIDQWVYRVKRLSDLDFEEEASELEQSLIELTRHDPELQSAFLHTLINNTGRLATSPQAY